MCGSDACLCVYEYLPRRGQVQPLSLLSGLDFAERDYSALHLTFTCDPGWMKYELVET